MKWYSQRSFPPTFSLHSSFGHLGSTSMLACPGLNPFSALSRARRSEILVICRCLTCSWRINFISAIYPFFSNSYCRVLVIYTIIAWLIGVKLYSCTLFFIQFHAWITFRPFNLKKKIVRKSPLALYWYPLSSVFFFTFLWIILFYAKWYLSCFYLCIKAKLFIKILLYLCILKNSKLSNLVLTFQMKIVH